MLSKFETLMRAKSVRLAYPRLNLTGVIIQANAPPPVVVAPGIIDGDNIPSIPSLVVEEGIVAEIRAKHDSRSEFEQKRQERKRKYQELQKVVADQRRLEQELLAKEKADRESKEMDKLQREHKEKKEAEERVLIDRVNMVREFQSVTGKQDRDKCMQFLSVFDFKLQKAVSMFFEKPEKFDTLTSGAKLKDGCENQEEGGSEEGKVIPSDNRTVIDFTLPEGSTIQETFNTSDTLFIISQFVTSRAAAWQYQPFTLVAQNPKRTFTQAEIHSFSLQDAGLSPRGSIEIVLGRIGRSKTQIS